MFFKKHLKLNYNLLIVAFFLILALIMSLPLLHFGRLAISSDGSYHFSRLEEMYQNLKRGVPITYISAFTFNKTGVGSYLFYPYLFLYPWALLRFMFNPVTSFYIWYGLALFVTFLISYYSMNSFSKNRVMGLLFSLIYTTAAYHLYLGIWHYVLGEFIAYTFIPLVFLGFYEVIWRDYHKWYLLSIGISLIAYSHLLSLTLIIEILAIIFIAKLIYQPKFAKERWFALIKAAILTFLLSAWVVVPFLTDLIGEGLGTPNVGISHLISFNKLIGNSISNYSTVPQSIGLTLIIVVLIGWYFVKNDKKYLSIYILGILFFMAASTAMPWRILGKTPLLVMQFPFRFLSYASLFLSMVAAYVLSKLFVVGKRRNNILILVCLVLAVIGLYFSSMDGAIGRIQTKNSDYSQTKKISKFESMPYNTQFDKNNYNNMFKYLVHFGETDYYHKESFDNNNIKKNKNTQSIISHKVIKNGKQINNKQPTSAPNQITYKVKSNKNDALDLPVISYHNTSVTNNGKDVGFTTSKRGTVKVKANSGINKIAVSYKPSISLYIGLFVSMITWIVMLFFKVKHKN